jgi:hypothetical protein
MLKLGILFIAFFARNFGSADYLPCNSSVNIDADQFEAKVHSDNHASIVQVSWDSQILLFFKNLYEVQVGPKMVTRESKKFLPGCWNFWIYATVFYIAHPVSSNIVYKINKILPVFWIFTLKKIKLSNDSKNQ